ncbi:hypothetical protein KKC52_03320 [bacterium]|nr:hypothetical protein [bacterium]
MKKLFFHNLGLKLLSLILAAVLWFYLATENLDARDMVPVRLKFENLPSNLILSETSRDSVVVRVKGQKDTILVLLASDFSYLLDLSKATAGRHNYSLDKDKVLHPLNVRVIKVIPDKVEVVLEEIGS